MSWLYSRVLVEEYSEGISLDGAQSALWNGTPTQPASWLPARMTDACHLSRSGMTFKPLTDDLGAGVLMSFLEAFPAKTFHVPEKAQESTASGLECGWKWLESLVKFDLVSRSWKTRQCSLLEGLDVFSETWPKWGSMRDGECSELPASEHSTDENAFGFTLFTPTATEGKRQNISSPVWKRRMNTRNTPGTLPEQLAWMGYEGLLTPEFNEMAMLWPERWTDLKSSAMDKFQLWQHRHGQV